jgi:hypothetical protein
MSALEQWPSHFGVCADVVWCDCTSPNPNRGGNISLENGDCIHITPIVDDFQRKRCACRCEESMCDVLSSHACVS